MKKMNRIQYNEIRSILKLQKDVLHIISAKVMQSIYYSGRNISDEGFRENCSGEFNVLFYGFGVKLMDIAVRIDNAVSFLKEGSYCSLRHVLSEAIFISDSLAESLKDEKVILGRGREVSTELEKFSSTFALVISYIDMDTEPLRK